MERGTIMTKKLSGVCISMRFDTTIGNERKMLLMIVRICLLEGSEVTLTRVERIRDGY